MTFYSLSSDNDTQRNDTSTAYTVPMIALLASSGSVFIMLAAVLLVTIIIGFITCKVHHQRGNNNINAMTVIVYNNIKQP